MSSACAQEAPETAKIPVKPPVPVQAEASTAEQKDDEDSQDAPAETPSKPADQGPAPLHSIDDPHSIWVISNKLRPLDPVDFEPNDLVYPEGVINANGQPLREVAAIAGQNIIFDAAQDGVHMGIISAYRPYDLQVSLFNTYVARDGLEYADRYSARPGHSEHQTGLVIDFDDFTGCGLDQCFESTPAGIWLMDHAADYGFVMRYPNGYEHITGFMYEPWHYRYVGPELAVEMRAAGVKTLEEWFDLPAAPGYDYPWH